MIGDIIMKRSIFIIVLLALLFPLVGISQNNAPIIDDIYYKPGVTNTTQPSNKQDRNSANKPNYKNGAKEIIYKETTGTKPKPVIRDTVYVVGEAGDTNRNTSKKPVPSLVNSDMLVIHDTIYVSEIAIDDSIQNNQDKGYYLNGFNGNSSDLEYAERIRRFHNPKYTVFIGDPNYNDIYFLNNNDWNVYVDGPYAYVTPTWTNPYWMNYNFSPYSYGSFGLGYGGFGFGWNNYPWSYNNFYGGFGGSWGGYYGFGSYWGDYYGYGYPYGYGYSYPYGYGYGYGGSYSFNKNRTHDEGARREVTNYGSGGSRLGGTRNSSSMMISGGNTSRTANQYTVVSNTRSNTLGSTNTLSTRSASTRSEAALNSRPVSNQASGIGVVRASGITRTMDNVQNTTGANTASRSSSANINTRPRTYSTTVTTTPTDNYTSRQNSSYTNASSNRTSYTEGSRTVISNSTPSYQTRSNSSYNSNNNSSSSRSYTPASSYSSSSSSSSSTSSSSSGSSGGGSRSSSSGGGGSRR